VMNEVLYLFLKCTCMWWKHENVMNDGVLYLCFKRSCMDRCA
jgi:hypothetical protein